MEKVVLSKGYEFELVPNAVNANSNTITITFKPGEYTVEQLLGIWSGNETMTVKIDDTSINVYSNYTKCASVTIVPNYLISTEYVCPACGAQLADPNATTCTECDATFDAPTMTEIRATVCTIKCMVPDINDRMNDVEDSVDDLISSMLILTSL